MALGYGCSPWLRKQDGMHLPSGGSVCLGPFTSLCLEKLRRGSGVESKAGLGNRKSHPPSTSSREIPLLKVLKLKQSHQLGTEHSNTGAYVTVGHHLLGPSFSQCKWLACSTEVRTSVRPFLSCFTLGKATLTPYTTRCTLIPEFPPFKTHNAPWARLS